MQYLQDGAIQIPIKLYNHFISNVVSKIFKILPIYEDCEMGLQDFCNFYSYLDKMSTMLIGSDFLYDSEVFAEVAAIIKGMQKRDDLDKKKVKSMVFHCIDMLDKIKKPEVN